MNQFAVQWNLGKDILSRSGHILTDKSAEIKRRGYLKEVNLNGELRLFLVDYPDASLSVTNIAGGICPQYIDAYLEKSPFSPLRAKTPAAKSLKRAIRDGGYPQQAGNLFEDLLRYANSLTPTSSSLSYDDLRTQAKEALSTLQEHTQIDLSAFRSSQATHLNGGDPEWFMGQLEYCLAFEMVMGLVHPGLQKNVNGSLQPQDPTYKPRVSTDIYSLGLSESTPDFFVKELGLVGDIKSGQHFQYKFLLTCAGYALALEKKRRRKVNWGAIVFEPNEVCTTITQPFTLPQVYIFAITDELRRDFLERRDQIYAQNKSQSIPIPMIDQAQRDAREYCSHCKYSQVCHSVYGMSIP